MRKEQHRSDNLQYSGTSLDNAWNGITHYSSLFVDIRKAFYSFRHESLRNIMANYGIPRKLINMVKLFYENYSCSVEHGETIKLV